MQSSKTFRVFVSSTFSDLKAERNALQEQVFPKLRVLCKQHGCRFQAIDLRWGVSEEAGFDQQTMRICLGEVERCQQLSPRPNFILLLGDRYGWQPLPYEIPAVEFDALTQHLDTNELTFFETWYRLDENAVPPVHDLLPREGVFEEHGSWRSVEKELHRILRKGIDKVELPDNARLKYFSSATEQEIYKGALDEPDASEHVFCFFRGISNLPQDAVAKEFIDLTEAGCLDEEAHGSLTKLKEKLHHDLPGNVHEYNDCSWTGSGITAAHIKQLCDDVYQELSDIISAELASLQQVDSHEQEIANHALFADERSHNFTGRVEIQKQILTYVSGDSTIPMAVCGEGGSGKSALMAQVTKRITCEYPDAAVVSRFIGATPSSSNIFSLLESLCRQIAGLYEYEVTIPTEYKELVEEFQKVLGLATSEMPLILLLDALDQLSDAENAKSLQWLQVALPGHVKVIVSVLTPSECFDHLKRKLPEEQTLLVEAMASLEAEALLDLWLDEAKRVLQPSQRLEVLVKFEQCELPLYLKIAFEEARHWKSYGAEEISGLNIQEIIMEFLGNLSEESRHGAVLVKHALGYLAAGKNGLTEEEMLDLLSLDVDVKEAFRKRSPNSPITDRLPVVVWSRLYLDLRPYLTERNADQASVMCFFHREFGEVVRKTFLDAETNRELHRRIAGYFASQPYLYQSDAKKVPNYRKVSEIAYQMMQGELWEELEKTITDFDFPMTKCMAGMVDELIQEYQRANTFSVPDKEAMRMWADFFRDRAHVLRRGNDQWPAYKILFQVAYEFAITSPITRQAEMWMDALPSKWPWLKRVNRDSEPIRSACLNVYEGHSGPISSLGFTMDSNLFLSSGEDGRVLLWDIASGAYPKCVSYEEKMRDRVFALLSGGSRIVMEGVGHTISIIDMNTGEQINQLYGHAEAINDLVVHPDGIRLISCSRDRTIKVWDIATARCLRTFSDYTAVPEKLLISTDGSQVIMLTDHEVVQWNFEKGTRSATLIDFTPHKGWRFYLSPERMVVIATDKEHKIEVWDIEHGACEKTLIVDDIINGSITFHPDGKSLFAVSDLGCLLQVSADTGEVMERIHAHDARITSIVTSSDGRHLLTGGGDNVIKRWDLTLPDNSMDGFLRKDHLTNVFGLGIAMDDQTIVSSSYYDRTIKLWDFVTCECLSTFVSPDDNVHSILAIPGRPSEVVLASKGRIHIFDLQNGLVTETLDIGVKKDEVLFLSDGRMVVLANKSIEVWDITSQQCQQKFNQESLGLTTLAVHPSVDLIFTGSYDPSVDIWDLSSGRCLRRIYHHKSLIKALACHPAGHILLSIDSSGIAILSNINSGAIKKAFRVNVAKGMRVAFLPEGDAVVTIGRDKVLRLYDLVSGELRIAYHSSCVPESLVVSNTGRIIIGDSAGHVIFLDPQNLDQESNGHTLGNIGTVAVGAYRDGITFESEIHRGLQHQLYATELKSKGHIAEAVAEYTRCIEVLAPIWQERHLPACDHLATAYKCRAKAYALLGKEALSNHDKKQSMNTYYEKFKLKMSRLQVRRDEIMNDNILYSFSMQRKRQGDDATQSTHPETKVADLAKTAASSSINDQIGAIDLKIEVSELVAERLVRDGDLVTAGHVYDKIIALKERGLSEGTLSTEDGIASVLLLRGKLLERRSEAAREAEEKKKYKGLAQADYQRAIEIRSRLSAHGHTGDDFSLVEPLLAAARLGSDVLAISLYSRALEVMSRSNATRTVNAIIDKEVAVVLLRRGDMIAGMKEYSKAIEDYDGAIEILDTLQSEGKLLDVRLLLDTLSSRSKAHMSIGHKEKYIADVRKTIQLLEGVSAVAEPMKSAELASKYEQLGYWFYEHNNNIQSIESYTKSIEIREALRRNGCLDEPNDLARIYGNRALCLKRNEPSKAALDYSNAIEIREGLLHEGKEYILESLVDIHSYRAALDTVNGPQIRALASYDRAIELTEGLVASGQIEQREKLAELYSHRAKPLAMMEEHDRATKSHCRAIELLEGLYQEAKLKDLSFLIREKQSYAANLAASGHVNEAIAYLGEVVDLCELEGDAHNAAKTLNQRGYLLMGMARMEEALDEFGRSIKICRTLLVQKDIGTSANLASVLHSKAECFERMGQIEEALKLYYDGKTLLEHCKGIVTSSWAEQILSELEALRMRCEQKTR